MKTTKTKTAKTPVEAYGTKGMKNTQWRKTFKSVEAMNSWVEKNDATVLGMANDLSPAPVAIPVIKMTPATHKLFVSLVEDMGNWGGHPMVDVDVKTRANLMDLKVKKLLRTHEEKNEGNPTVQFASFTFVEVIDVAVKGTGIIERFTPSSIDAGVATVVAREIVATK